MKHLTKLLATALLALGLNQAVWADDTSDFRQTLQLAEQGNAEAQNNLGLMYHIGQGTAKTMSKRSDGFGGRQRRGMSQPNLIWV